MSYTYRNFATNINFKKGFLQSFLIDPLIAFNNGRTVSQGVRVHAEQSKPDNPLKKIIFFNID